MSISINVSNDLQIKMRNELGDFKWTICYGSNIYSVAQGAQDRNNIILKIIIHTLDSQNMYNLWNSLNYNLDNFYIHIIQTKQTVPKPLLKRWSKLIIHVLLWFEASTLQCLQKNSLLSMAFNVL